MAENEKDEKAESKPKPKPKPTRVRRVSTKGGMMLVEWEDPKGDGLQRYWVTMTMIVDTLDDDGNYVTVEAPERGVPYGVDWKAVLPKLKTTTTDVANEFKRRGIWTYEDMSRNPNLVRTALATALGLDLAAILTAAREDARNGG